MWLCLSATTLSSQTTPELREIFTDPILTKLVLEEVGFYEKSPAQNQKKAWRVACDGPGGSYKGLWRADSMEVVTDVTWINVNTNDTCWCDDTLLVDSYKSIPAPEVPVFNQPSAPDLISSGLTWYEMDSIEFEIDKRIIFRLIAEVQEIKIKKNLVFYKTTRGSSLERGIGSYAQTGNWYYATRETSKDGKKDYYHFYNQDEEWLQGFFVDSKNMRVWNTGPQKGPEFKKIFKK